MHFHLLNSLALLASVAWSQNTNSKVPGSNPLTYCSPSPSTDILHISSVDFAPNPPVKGHQLTISANGSTTQPIQQGDYINLVVKWGMSSQPFPSPHSSMLFAS